MFAHKSMALKSAYYIPTYPGNVDEHYSIKHCGSVAQFLNFCQKKYLQFKILNDFKYLKNKWYEGAFPTCSPNYQEKCNINRSGNRRDL